MNTTPLTIYLWQLADKLTDFSKGTAVICFAAGVIFSISSTFPELEDDTMKSLRKSCRKLIIAAASLGCLATLLPSSSTIAMMVVVPEIAHSKVIQQDLPDIYNAAVDALKNQLKK